MAVGEEEDKGKSGTEEEGKKELKITDKESWNMRKEEGWEPWEAKMANMNLNDWLAGNKM